jgi:hypothetical protein
MRPTMHSQQPSGKARQWLASPASSLMTSPTCSKPSLCSLAAMGRTLVLSDTVDSQLRRHFATTLMGIGKLYDGGS